MTNIKNKEQEGLKAIKVINDVLAELIQCLIDDDMDKLNMLNSRLEHSNKQEFSTNQFYSFKEILVLWTMLIVIIVLCVLYVISLTT